MARIRLTVAYDGTNYHGWQSQKNGNTVQDEIERAISGLTGECVRLIGASRTDAGVHALGNVCVFDTKCRIPAEKFALALNAYLPEDIRVQSSEETSADWHPRHTDCRKTYEYRILNRGIQVPTIRNTTYFVHDKLDIGKMQEAAEYVKGRHDFASFCSAGSAAESTVRTVFECDVKEQDGDIVTIRITGDGFLYNMVRIIAGTLIEIGKEQRAPEDMRSIIEARDRRAAGPTAPAKGLMLVEIKYNS